MPPLLLFLSFQRHWLQTFIHDGATVESDGMGYENTRIMQVEKSSGMALGKGQVGNTSFTLTSLIEKETLDETLNDHKQHRYKMC